MVLTYLRRGFHVQNNHWVLTLVDLRTQSLNYYDSYYGPDHSSNLDLLEEYIIEEYDLAKRIQPTTWCWSRHYPKDIPRQTNTYDCGVFMWKLIEYKVHSSNLCGSDYNWTEHNMQDYRREMVLQVSASTNHVP